MTVSSDGNYQCQEMFSPFDKHVTVAGDLVGAVRCVGNTFPAVQHGSSGGAPCGLALALFHGTMGALVGRTSLLHHTRPQSVSEYSGLPLVQ
jgi:hypothetical protein